MIVAVTLAMAASIAAWYFVAYAPQPKACRVRIRDDQDRRPRG